MFRNLVLGTYALTADKGALVARSESISNPAQLKILQFLALNYTKMCININ